MTIGMIFAVISIMTATIDITIDKTWLMTEMIIAVTIKIIAVTKVVIVLTGPLLIREKAELVKTMFMPIARGMFTVKRIRDGSKRTKAVGHLNRAAVHAHPPANRGAIGPT